MKLFPLLTATLAIAAAPLYAQQQTQEQLIVTGTYTPLAAGQLSSNVSVLDRSQIEQLNKTNLADLLQSIPGVLVEQQGGPGGLAVASIRGGESNYTVVMVDGVALNDPGNTRGGAFDLGNINVDSIERIEVVKGPQSAIYGADALAGVINIISLRPENGHRQTLTLSGGADDYQQAGFSALGKNDNVNYSFQARVHDSGEPVEGSTAENTEVNVRFGWQPGAAHQLSASYRYFDGERTSFPEQSGGPEFATSRLLDNTDYTDESAALTWQYQIAEFWKSNLQATLYQREEDYSSPGIAPYFAVPPNGARSEFERQQVSWVNTLGQPGKFWANLGLENRKEDGDSRGYLDLGFLLPTDFSLDRSTDSGFVDVSAQLNDRLLVQGSVRLDDTDGFDSETSSKVGLRYQLSEQLIWRVNAGEGYKLPSFFALGHPLVGNPNLKAERVESWDTGFEWQMSDHFSTSVDYFQNTFRDPIDFDSELFTNVNRERVDTSGVEWQAQWRSLDGDVSINANASYTDIDVKDQVSVLTGRPQWTGGLAFNWQLNDDWRTSADYQWVCDQYATSQHTGDTTIHELDNYQRLNANVFWAINESLQANVTLENVFDSTYESAVGFPAPGVQWRIGLRWTFSQE